MLSESKQKLTGREMKTLQIIRGSSVLLLLMLTWVCIDGYKPVVIVHGLFDGPEQFKTLADYIHKVHPGTNVMAINIYDDKWSLWPLWKQVEGFREILDSIMKEAPDVHLLCFSQGGLLCRALLSTIPDHNVHTFISLSSPLAGQYGLLDFSPSYSTETDYLKIIAGIKWTVHRICYSRLGQILSFCSYWNDPHHRARYLQKNKFLPLLNGERPHDKMKAWKENFLRIKKLVLIGGPDDGVITPWQSSHFGFYDCNENVVEMRKRKFYKKDAFGLKTLDARGDVLVCVRSGVKHTEWHSNFTVFMSCMEEWLI